MWLTIKEKQALTREVSKRYQQAGKKEKTKILDEFTENTGYNRKEKVHKAVDALMTLNRKRELEGVKSLAASALQVI